MAWTSTVSGVRGTVFSISSGVMPSALGAFGVGEAVAHAGGHEPQPGPVQGGLGGVELGQHLLAVGALLDQALHATQLPFGAAEPVEHLVGDLVGKLHGCHSIPGRVSRVGSRVVHSRARPECTAV